MMKKSTLLLLLIIISFSSNAQNEIKKKLTDKSIDSLKIEFDMIVKRIDIKRRQPPKIPNVNNKNITNTNTSLEEECSIIVTTTIEKYGWLNTSEVGENINNNLGLIIEHASDSIKNKYKSLIKI